MSNKPARIIEPATGASTCALGSQRWVEYKGIFTIKAVIDISHHINNKLLEVAGCQWGESINNVLLDLKININLSRRGKEAMTV